VKEENLRECADRVEGKAASMLTLVKGGYGGRRGGRTALPSIVATTKEGRITLEPGGP